MKYKLVEFIDGTWGILVIRPRWKFWQKEKFVDLTFPKWRWDKDQEHFSDCKRDRDKAESVLKSLNAYTYRIVEP